MRPLIEQFDTLDIQNASSKEINEYIKALSSDIVNICSAYNKKEVEYKQMIGVLIQENSLLKNTLEDLEEKAKKMQSLVNIGGHKEYYTTFYSDEDIFNNQTVQDTDYGIITLDNEQIYKKCLENIPMELLKKHAFIELKIFKENEADAIKTINSHEDQALLNVLLNDNTKVWSYNFSDTIAEYVRCEVYITLPYKLLSTARINTIGVQTFPFNSFGLTKIAYLDNDNTAISLYESANRISNTKVQVQEIKGKKIKLTFLQANPDTYNGTNNFAIGIRNIDIDFVKPNTDSGYFITKVVSANGSFFNTVQSPTVNTLSNSMVGAIDHTLYLDNSLSIDIPFGQTIAGNYNTLYIKTKLRNIGGAIPMLKDISVLYTTK